MMRGAGGWTPRRTIVAGVNGSSGSKVALRWALEQAERTGADVEAVNVWSAQPAYYACMPVGFAVDDLAAVAETVLLDTMVEVTRDYGRSVPIRPRVVRGFPAEELLRAARAAQLLVLGAPRHGALAGLLSGSVSHQCVQRSSCPVVIAPAVPYRPEPRLPRWVDVDRQVIPPRS
ncbi:universal stress protein [Paractinoplanes rhizophilus]|jgi:nucleotide-binding universal stress UspA family protein|uniref:Universal stress protein n=1 Tax=Paractinoplanes rhizophilus TaxID=1416877 RepID=A0ABW2I2E6_9ACTN|nr:universal stress protein [Actinoplanes sp.]